MRVYSKGGGEEPKYKWRCLSLLLSSLFGYGR